MQTIVQQRMIEQMVVPPLTRTQQLVTRLAQLELDVEFTNFKIRGRLPIQRCQYTIASLWRLAKLSIDGFLEHVMTLKRHCVSATPLTLLGHDTVV
jgi:hypothetical protein